MKLDPFKPYTRISSKWIELPDKVEPYNFKFKKLMNSSDTWEWGKYNSNFQKD